MSHPIKLRLWSIPEGYYLNAMTSAFGYALAAYLTGAMDRLEQRAEFDGSLVIERWTGLVDNTGREIYEGDIIQRIWVFATNDNVYLYGDAPPGHYTEEPNMIGVVEYSAFDAQYTLVSYKCDKWTARAGFSHGKWSDARGTRYKVLGNIHQNRELLS